MAGETEPLPLTGSHRNTFRWAEIAYAPSVFVVGAGLWLIVAGLALRGGFAGESASGWNKLTVGALVTLIAAIRDVRSARTACTQSCQRNARGAWTDRASSSCSASPPRRRAMPCGTGNMRSTVCRTTPPPPHVFDAGIGLRDPAMATAASAR